MTSSNDAGGAVGSARTAPGSAAGATSALEPATRLGRPEDHDNHAAALQQGTRLFEYRIDAVLGFGGFGITYLAQDTLLDEPVAIKEFFPSHMAVRTDGQSARARSRREADAFRNGVSSFLDEARIIARFRHPNIMQVRRFFEAHGTGYMVLEFIHGQSMEEMLGEGPLPEPVVRRALDGILDGLATLHGREILHRDLKPRNVIVRPDGNPVLIDFGAARDFGFRHSATVTQIVSPNYSSPEQYGVGSRQGPWSDLYGLGAILYRAVTGIVPVDALRRLKADPIEPASMAACGRYDPALLSLADALMAVDPEERPASVDAVRAMLVPTATTTAGAARAPLAAGPAAIVARARPTVSRRAAYAAGLAALAVAAAGGSASWFQRAGAPSRPGATLEHDVAPGGSETPRHADIGTMSARPAQPKAGTTFRDCPTCPGMVVIPPGSFQMGSADARPDERPVHLVTIATPLAIGRTEVTRGEWNACVREGSCDPRAGKGPGGDDLPATNVSWLDTQAYLDWLSKATGQRYRLPSEAEWEYAARGGTTGTYWWGNDAGSDRANCSDCGARPSDAVKPAASYAPNPFGLYDTAGNAAEWVQDCWTPSYRAAPSDGSAAEGGNCPQRVLRGGGFVNDARYLRSASRYRYETAVPYYAHGFRVASGIER